MTPDISAELMFSVLYDLTRAEFDALLSILGLSPISPNVGYKAAGIIAVVNWLIDNVEFDYATAVNVVFRFPAIGQWFDTLDDAAKSRAPYMLLVADYRYVSVTGDSMFIDTKAAGVQVANLPQHTETLISCDLFVLFTQLRRRMKERGNTNDALRATASRQA